MVTHLTDSLHKAECIEMINAITEQGAGFAAEGYARTTGKLGVAIATSGPGATNLLTPIASCFFDGVPALFLTGQVNTFEYKKFSNLRQCGFQETDIVSVAKPLTKYSVLVNDAHDLRYQLEKALHIAMDGRQGPVLLDLPMDIQRAELDFEQERSFFEERKEQPAAANTEELLDKIAEFEKAERPLILVGNGVRRSGAVERLRAILWKSSIPTVCSLMGLDAVPSDYEYHAGMLGSYGNRGANILVSEADHILVLGARLDIRQVGIKLSIFEKIKITQVDIEQAQLDCRNLSKDGILMDVRAFLEVLGQRDLSKNIQRWHARVKELKARYPSDEGLHGNRLLPNSIIKMLFSALRKDDVICVDVGQNQMWTAQSAIIQERTRVHFSGGLGAMGFALPAAIGCALSEKRAVVISGDGGFQMNIQELEVIRRRGLPVKMIVLNNNSLALVRQFQDMYFGGRNPSTVEDYSAPDFCKVAEAYDIPATQKKASEVTFDDFGSFFKDNSAGLLHIEFDGKTSIEPKVLFGNPINIMHPMIENDD